MAVPRLYKCRHCQPSDVQELPGTCTVFSVQNQSDFSLKPKTLNIFADSSLCGVSCWQPLWLLCTVAKCITGQKTSGSSLKCAMLRDGAGGHCFPSLSLCTPRWAEVSLEQVVRYQGDGLGMHRNHEGGRSSFPLELHIHSTGEQKAEMPQAGCDGAG